MKDVGGKRNIAEALKNLQILSFTQQMFPEELPVLRQVLVPWKSLEWSNRAAGCARVCAGARVQGHVCRGACAGARVHAQTLHCKATVLDIVVVIR